MCDVKSRILPLSMGSAFWLILDLGHPCGTSSPATRVTNQRHVTTPRQNTRSVERRFSFQILIRNNMGIGSPPLRFLASDAVIRSGRLGAALVDASNAMFWGSFRILMEVTR